MKDEILFSNDPPDGTTRRLNKNFLEARMLHLLEQERFLDEEGVERIADAAWNAAEGEAGR